MGPVKNSTNLRMKAGQHEVQVWEKRKMQKRRQMTPRDRNLIEEKMRESVTGNINL